ncbi:MAG TPA: HNH endonuclease [Symbiobacteriaceae bacterium]|nr:HNH endonuclease [Symbiobacteriaceae bacterium]
MRTSAAKRIEIAFGQPLREVLTQMYWRDQQSTPSIGEALGVSTSAVRKWMKELGIPRRDGSSAQKVITITGRRPKTTVLSQAGASNHNWKGGRIRHVKGYLLRHAPEHPNASGGYVLEHRLVAEEMLGRPLRPDEDVHHLDGDKANNSRDNLIVEDHGSHTRLHWAIRRTQRAAAV